MGGANGPCRIVKEDIGVIGVTESVILISAVHSICPRTLCTHSNIAFACGFLIVVGLRLIPYEPQRYSKFNI